jgi:hypothetical protein
VSRVVHGRGHAALGGSTGTASPGVLADGLQQRRGDLAAIPEPVCSHADQVMADLAAGNFTAVQGKFDPAMIQANQAVPLPKAWARLRPRPQGCQVRRLYLGQRRGRVHRSAAPGGSPGPAPRQRAGSRLPGARGRGRGNPGVADRSFLASHTRVLLCIARDPGVRWSSQPFRRAGVRAVPMTACAAGETGAWRRASLAQIARLLVSPVDWA